MKFKDFQAHDLFSSTFKALNLGEKNASTFKDFQGCVRTLIHTPVYLGKHGIAVKVVFKESAL